MSYKVFSNGNVLNASELNEFLMNQSVIAFSNATARSSAITSPVEGMITYLEDSNSYQSYDGSAWVGLVPQSPNAIINGAFDIWQRGTSTSSPGFLADRWTFNVAGAGSVTLSRQAFTPGQAPFAPEESAFFSRINITTAFTASNYEQKIEDVRTFAGKTVTLSFYAKADSAKTITPRLLQNFGSGGSTSVNYTLTDISLTTSWQRFTRTVALDSLTGKTIGSGSFLIVQPFQTGAQTGTFDIWGVQLEAGPVATPFRRNANSLQGELAACQRYFIQGGSSSGFLGQPYSTTAATFGISFPSMRAVPTLTFGSPINIGRVGSTGVTATSASLNTASVNYVGWVATGATGLTVGAPVQFNTNFEISAEL